MPYTKTKRILPFALVVLIASMLMFTGCNSFVEGFNEGYNQTSETEKNTTPSPSIPQPEQESPSPTMPMENTSVANSYPNEVLYKGEPIMKWMGARLADLRDVFGAPDIEGIVGEGAAYGFSYEDWGMVFIKRDQGEDIESISGMPSLLSVDGISLDTNRDKLVSLFGEPEYEDWGDNYGEEVYYMHFVYQGEYSISFCLDDPNGKAYELWISYADDSSGDSDGGGDSGFRRTDYFTGISYDDLLRNSDTYAYSKVYFDYFKVTEVLETKVYLAQSQRMLQENMYIVIDDRQNTGSNALVGDFLTTYGTFSEIITMNWNNGGSSQLPVIRPDWLIFNDVLPDDLTNFAQAMVENMNAYSFTIANNLGVQNQYLSGSTVKIAGLITPYQGVSVLTTGQTRNAGRVDGYDTMITWVYEPGGATKAIPDDFNQNKGLVTKDILSTFGIDIVEVNTRGDKLPIWITGEIAFIIPKPFSPPDVIVTFNITNIELMD